MENQEKEETAKEDQSLLKDQETPKAKPQKKAKKKAEPVSIPAVGLLADRRRRVKKGKK